MKSVDSEEMVAMPLIKKEDPDTKGCFQPYSPSSAASTALYSPTTTHLPPDVIIEFTEFVIKCQDRIVPFLSSLFQLKFGDDQYLGINENIKSLSPASPDHQYCSSTTQSIGDSMFPLVEVSLW